jgi:hypothetical protein
MLCRYTDCHYAVSLYWLPLCCVFMVNAECHYGVSLCWMLSVTMVCHYAECWVRLCCVVMLNAECHYGVSLCWMLSTIMLNAEYHYGVSLCCILRVIVLCHYAVSLCCVIMLCHYAVSLCCAIMLNAVYHYAVLLCRMPSVTAQICNGACYAWTLSKAKVCWQFHLEALSFLGRVLKLSLIFWLDSSENQENNVKNGGFTQFQESLANLIL